MSTDSFSLHHRQQTRFATAEKFTKNSLHRHQQRQNARLSAPSRVEIGSEKKDNKFSCMIHSDVFKCMSLPWHSIKCKKIYVNWFSSLRVDFIGFGIQQPTPKHVLYAALSQRAFCHAIFRFSRKKNNETSQVDPMRDGVRFKWIFEDYLSASADGPGSRMERRKQ